MVVPPPPLQQKGLPCFKAQNDGDPPQKKKFLIDINRNLMAN